MKQDIKNPLASFITQKGFGERAWGEVATLSCVCKLNLRVAYLFLQSDSSLCVFGQASTLTAR